jgi:RimJ/RimL family protein N-acetyltransferase
LHLDKNNNNAQFGYWVAEPFWGNGIATEATAAVLQFGFEKLNLNKIYATHFPDNKASGKVMLKNKMIKEGELKDHYRVNNEYRSVIQYRLTKQEYEKQKAASTSDDNRHDV